MPEITLKTRTGADAGTVTLADELFAVQPNVPVMHQVVTAQLANRRAGTHSTKTRAEVRGGGAKPYRQKGTGRSRQGSVRAPHFNGGGIALGPKPRSYRQRTPKKMIKLALRSALSDRAAEGKVVVVESWGLDAPKTKDAAAALAALGLEGRVLVVLDRGDTNAALSFRNLPEVQIIQVGELNAYDVLCNDWIVFTVSSLSALEAAGAASGRTGSSPLNDAAGRVPDIETRAASATEVPTVSSGTAARVTSRTGEGSASDEPDASESSSEQEDK